MRHFYHSIPTVPTRVLINPDSFSHGSLFHTLPSSPHEVFSFSTEPPRTDLFTPFVLEGRKGKEGPREH